MNTENPNPHPHEVIEQAEELRRQRPELQKLKPSYRHNQIDADSGDKLRVKVDMGEWGTLGDYQRGLITAMATRAAVEAGSDALSKCVTGEISEESAKEIYARDFETAAERPKLSDSPGSRACAAEGASESSPPVASEPAQASSLQRLVRSPLTGDGNEGASEPHNTPLPLVLRDSNGVSYDERSLRSSLGCQDHRNGLFQGCLDLLSLDMLRRWQRLGCPDPANRSVDGRGLIAEMLDYLNELDS